MQGTYSSKVLRLAEAVQLLQFWLHQFSQGKNGIPFLEKARNKQKC